MRAGSIVTYVSVVPVSTATVKHLVKVLLYPKHKQHSNVHLIPQGYAWASSGIVVPAKWEGRVAVSLDYEYRLEYAIYDKGGVEREFTIYAILEVPE